MNIIPPDWKEDKKLWETLGILPRVRPPTNFTYIVHQKLLVLSKKKGMVVSFSIGSLLRGWMGGFLTATACFLLLIPFLRRPQAESTKTLSQVSSLQTPSKNSVALTETEVALLAQHYELIQDLDIIEHLDEL